MTEPADLKSGETISLAMGRFDDHNSFINGRAHHEDEPAMTARRRSALIPILLPHLVIFLLMAAYITLVASVMYAMENQSEIEEQSQVKAELDTLRKELIAQFREGAELEAKSRAFVDRVFRMGWERGRQGRGPVPNPTLMRAETVNNSTSGETSGGSRWTVPNSILFATSLVSRIGYGHLVPTTPLGKVFSQLFALLGTPFFLVVVADFGKLLGDAIESIRIKPRRKRKRELMNGGNEEDQNPTPDPEPFEPINSPFLLCFFLSLFLGFCALMSVAYRHLEQWDWLDCFYFCFVSFYSIGFGDFAPSSPCSIIVTIFAIFFGLTFATLFVDLLGTHYLTNIHMIQGRFSKNGWNKEADDERKERRRREKEEDERKNGGTRWRG